MPQCIVKPRAASKHTCTSSFKAAPPAQTAGDTTMAARRLTLAATAAAAVRTSAIAAHHRAFSSSSRALAAPWNLFPAGAHSYCLVYQSMRERAPHEHVQRMWTDWSIVFWCNVCSSSSRRTAAASAAVLVRLAPQPRVLAREDASHRGTDRHAAAQSQCASTEEGASVPIDWRSQSS